MRRGRSIHDLFELVAGHEGFAILRQPARWLVSFATGCFRLVRRAEYRDPGRRFPEAVDQAPTLFRMFFTVQLFRHLDSY